MSYTPVMYCPAVADKAPKQEYQLRWLLVDGQQHIVSAVDFPKLADIQTDIKFGYLVLRAPGMLRLDIPMDVIEDDESAFEWVSLSDAEKALLKSVSNDVSAESIRVVSEGDLAAQWFSVYLEQPIRLMKRV